MIAQQLMTMEESTLITSKLSASKLWPLTFVDSWIIEPPGGEVHLFHFIASWAIISRI